MTSDQKKRIAELSAQITEVLIEELNLANWPAADVPLREQQASERGNRLNHKKSIVQTLLIVDKLAALDANSKAALGRDPYTENELEEQIDKYAAQASQALDRAAHGLIG